MTTIQIRPYKRDSDELGNVSMQYGRPMWEQIEPTDEDFTYALKLMNRWPMTALFMDNLPVTLYHGAAS